MTVRKVSSSDAVSLEAVLVDLQKAGCFPTLSYRGGGVWRAHATYAENFWKDAKTPLKAVLGAVSLWRRAGCPKPAGGAPHA